jgi:hypothetical protein
MGQRVRAHRQQDLLAIVTASSDVALPGAGGQSASRCGCCFQCATCIPRSALRSQLCAELAHEHRQELAGTQPAVAGGVAVRQLVCSRRRACSRLHGGLLLDRQSSHALETSGSGVMQPSAIGAADDCCDRGRSRSSRSLLPTGRASGGAGAHCAYATGCDSRADGVAVTAGGPGIWASVRRTAADRRPRARGVAPPDGRNGRSVAATVAAPVIGGPAPARVRMSTALTRERSAAAEGVRHGRRPGPVQIDGSRRRGPFSGM